MVLYRRNIGSEQSPNSIFSWDMNRKTNSLIYDEDTADSSSYLGGDYPLQLYRGNVLQPINDDVISTDGIRGTSIKISSGIHLLAKSNLYNSDTNLKLRIQNQISNDFSIGFWMKFPTQLTAGYYLLFRQFMVTTEGLGIYQDYHMKQVPLKFNYNGDYSIKGLHFL